MTSSARRFSSVVIGRFRGASLCGVVAAGADACEEADAWEADGCEDCDCCDEARDITGVSVGACTCAPSCLGALSRVKRR